MRADPLPIAAILLLIACAQPGTQPGPEVGVFTSAGPTSGVSERRTVRWAYGFQFSIDPRSVTRVLLSCGDIQGTGVVVTAEEIGADSTGKASWYGPEYLLSDESVPWLFEGRTTSAICQAVLSREGFPDSVARMPVTFTGAVKRETLNNLRWR